MYFPPHKKTLPQRLSNGTIGRRLTVLCTAFCFCLGSLGIYPSNPCFHAYGQGSVAIHPPWSKGEIAKMSRGYMPICMPITIHWREIQMMQNICWYCHRKPRVHSIDYVPSFYLKNSQAYFYTTGAWLINGRASTRYASNNQTETNCPTNMAESKQTYLFRPRSF